MSIVDALFDAPIEVSAGGLRWRIAYVSNDDLSDLRAVRLKLVRDQLEMLAGTRHQEVLKIEDEEKRQIAIQAASADLLIQAREADPEHAAQIELISARLTCDAVTGLFDPASESWVALRLTLDPEDEDRATNRMLATRLGPTWHLLIQAVVSAHQGGETLSARLDAFRSGSGSGTDDRQHSETVRPQPEPGFRTETGIGVVTERRSAVLGNGPGRGSETVSTVQTAGKLGYRAVVSGR